MLPLHSLSALNISRDRRPRSFRATSTSPEGLLASCSVPSIYLLISPIRHLFLPNSVHRYCPAPDPLQYAPLQHTQPWPAWISPRMDRPSIDHTNLSSTLPPARIPPRHGRHGPFLPCLHHYRMPLCRALPGTAW